MAHLIEDFMELANRLSQQWAGLEVRVSAVERSNQHLQLENERLEGILMENQRTLRQVALLGAFMEQRFQDEFLTFARNYEGEGVGGFRGDAGRGEEVGGRILPVGSSNEEEMNVVEPMDAQKADTTDDDAMNAYRQRQRRSSIDALLDPFIGRGNEREPEVPPGTAGIVIAEVVDIQLPPATVNSIPDLIDIQRPGTSTSAVAAPIPVNNAENNNNGAGEKEELEVEVDTEKVEVSIVVDDEEKLLPVPPVQLDKPVQKKKASHCARRIRLERPVPEMKILTSSRNAAGVGQLAGSTPTKMVSRKNQRQGRLRRRSSKEPSNRKRQDKRTTGTGETGSIATLKTPAANATPRVSLKTPDNRSYQLQRQRRLSTTPFPFELQDRHFITIRRSERVEQQQELRSLMSAAEFRGEEPPQTLRQSRRQQERRLQKRPVFKCALFCCAPINSFANEETQLKKHPLQCPRCLKTYCSKSYVRCHMKTVACRHR